MKETHAVVGHETAKEGGGLFSIDPGLVIWTWVVFGLLLVVLRKFAWKPMMESVEQRESTMRRAVEQAEKTRIELERITQTQETMLRKAQEEARSIITEGRASADSVARRIKDEAEKQAKKTIEEAKEQLSREKELVLREIREQSVDMILSVSEKLMVASLDDTTHRNLVRKHLEEW